MLVVLNVVADDENQASPSHFITASCDYWAG
jgi:hypothetical protein